MDPPLSSLKGAARARGGPGGPGKRQRGARTDRDIAVIKAPTPSSFRVRSPHEPVQLFGNTGHSGGSQMWGERISWSFFSGAPGPEQGAGKFALVLQMLTQSRGTYPPRSSDLQHLGQKSQSPGEPSTASIHWLQDLTSKQNQQHHHLHFLPQPTHHHPLALRPTSSFCFGTEAMKPPCSF